MLLIRVQPTPDQMVPFARWAVQQTPAVETCSHAEFCVPQDLFTDMPEELLIGAIVDGHRYQSPEEDEQQAAKAKRSDADPAGSSSDAQPLAAVDGDQSGDQGDEEDTEGGKDSGDKEKAPSSRSRARRTQAASSRRKTKEDGS